MRGVIDGGRIGYDMGGDVEMASYGYDDAMSETRELFMQYKKRCFFIRI